MRAGRVNCKPVSKAVLAEGIASARFQHCHLDSVCKINAPFKAATLVTERSHKCNSFTEKPISILQEKVSAMSRNNCMV